MTTRTEYQDAVQAGRDAGPMESCPFTGILAAAWRDGHRAALTERRAGMRERVEAAN